MNEMPLISVIIPTYNRFPMLNEAIASVKNQSFTDFEIIIADDGSTDETCSLSSVPGLVYLPLKHTGFPGAVRNRGAEIAKGKYLAFLDSDDLWLPEKLEKQLDVFSSVPNARLVHTREKWLRHGKVVSQKSQKHKREGDVFADALKKCMIGPSTVMLERELFFKLGSFREDIEVAEDYELWLRLTAFNEVSYIDEPLVIKQAGDWDQLSEKYGHIEYFRIMGLKDLADRDFFPEQRKAAALTELSFKCRVYAEGALKRGKDDEAGEYFRLSAMYQNQTDNCAPGPV